MKIVNLYEAFLDEGGAVILVVCHLFYSLQIGGEVESSSHTLTHTQAKMRFECV